MSRSFLTVATHATLGAFCLFSTACSKQKPKYLAEFAPMMQDYGGGISVDGEPELRHASTVPVELAEWQVSVSPEALPAGATTFEVHNVGTMAHVFEIEGNGIEVRTKQIAPGEVSTLSVKLERGNYELYCPLGAGSHKEKGMHAAIQVAE
jgi:uncharacterized cupredoxin-like copper-binding protein